ncbi:DNA-directed RNA polymerase subunit H [Candidatus Woesearchaeota archaeon]|nr:DNA-directed RNA polymerase subunit H [Candidatus Woesearchaeota archaeon]
MTEAQPFQLHEHTLVPKHEKLQEEEKQKLLHEYNLSIKQLPQIKLSDPALQHLQAQIGDVIKITRASPTVGETFFYRVVIYG